MGLILLGLISTRIFVNFVVLSNLCFTPSGGRLSVEGSGTTLIL